MSCALAVRFCPIDDVARLPFMSGLSRPRRFDHGRRTVDPHNRSARPEFSGDLSKIAGAAAEIDHPPRIGQLHARRQIATGTRSQIGELEILPRAPGRHTIESIRHKPSRRGLKMHRRYIFIAAGLVVLAAAASAQWKPKDTEWPSYNADTMGSRYRPLESDQRVEFRQSCKSPGDSRPTPSATAPSSS